MEHQSQALPEELKDKLTACMKNYAEIESQRPLLYGLLVFWWTIKYSLYLCALFCLILSVWTVVFDSTQILNWFEIHILEIQANALPKMFYDDLKKGMLVLALLLLSLALFFGFAGWLVNLQHQANAALLRQRALMFELSDCFDSILGEGSMPPKSEDELSKKAQKYLCKSLLLISIVVPILGQVASPFLARYYLINPVYVPKRGNVYKAAFLALFVWITLLYINL